MSTQRLRVAPCTLLSLALLLSPDLAAASVPLVQGLTVTTAIAEPDGDYESRKQLMARADDGWRLWYSASRPINNGEPESISGERLLHDADLLSARAYRNRFESNTEEDYPGTTALGTSSEVLKELQTTGKSRFALVGDDQWIAQSLAAVPGGADSVLGLAAALMAGNGVSFKGELQRQSTGTMSVLVNGQLEALPVLIASGHFTAKNGQTMDAELSFLDDPANPIALQWRIGESRLRVVKVDYPQPESDLATALKQQKRITLPGLYFDFGSAVLKSESAANLPAIVEAIRTAPPGVLRLEGHTDNVGDDARNQALSLARAEAVHTALIALDASLAARLKAEGFGETRPQARNTTLEGRAQNRRVELVVP